MPAPASLPGIRVLSAPSAPDAVLPRMDIAVFAGFAASGPLHLPVVVESPAQFETVFGGEATLAWDAARGETVTAHLRSTVAGFFANGGRRCWIIRLARTAALEALWRGLDVRSLPPDDLIVTNRFPLPGVLARPREGAGVVAAEAAARAAGSWSDDVRVATALRAEGFDVTTWQPAGAAAPLAVSLVPAIPLASGDLVQFAGADTLFARVDTADASSAQVTLLAAFAAISTLSPQAGSAQIAGVTGTVPATLSVDADGARIGFGAPVPAGAETGQWVRWSDGGSPVWLRADALDTARAAASPDRFTLTVRGPAWRERPLAMPAQPPAHALRLTLDVRADDGGAARRASGLGLTPVHPASWWTMLDDDRYYRQAGDPVDRFPLAAAEALADAPDAWLPLGVAALDSDPCGPFAQPATPLERDGLSRYDAELFLDPDLAGVGIDVLADAADQIRFLADPGRELFGIHASLGIGNAGLFDEPSLLAVPDALHTGWTRTADATPLPIPPAPGPATAAPGFAACSRPELTPPVLTGPDGPVAIGSVHLQWTEAAPGVAGTLQESRDPGFTLTRALSDGTTRSADVAAERAGTFYYRVTAASGAVQVSSNVLSVVVQDSGWRALSASEYAVQGEAELARVQRAALLLAASAGDIFAVLGLPRHARGPDLARLTARLRTTSGFGVARALAFGAVYHPWLVNGALRPTPPDGVMAGVLAARAAGRGAWIAPANEVLRDVVALLPAPDAAAALAGLQGWTNMLTSAARGFVALSARTLSDEPGLDMINVRRLLSLLRRLALRQGAAYVFEPLGDTLRRSVERGFGQLLSDLYRRGAFAGATEAASFDVVTGAGVSTQADLDDGRLIAELRVAPSVPMQFLTLALVQTGERLSISEQAS